MDNDPPIELTSAERKLIIALRRMPKTGWSYELSMCTVGEGRTEDEMDEGWGDAVWCAFRAFAEERGEPEPSTPKKRFLIEW